MWFTETAWPPIVILGALAVALFAAWYRTRHAPLLAAAVLLLLACPVIWYFERTTITPAEEVEAVQFGLINAFVHNDAERAAEYISVRSPELRTAILVALSQIDVEGELRVTDMSVRMTSANSRGLCHFRANGTITVPAVGHRGHHASRWLFTWQREANEFKLLRVQRLNPMSGEEIEWWAPID